MSFVNILFLAGAVTMAVPLLLHFVRRMQAKQVAFGSLMFLSPTPKELVKKRRLRDVLLMAIRMFILGMIVLAFARPFTGSDRLPFLSSEGNSSTVYLVDESYSMSAGDVWQRAQEALTERVGTADSDDEMALVFFSDVQRQVAGLGTGSDVIQTIAGSILTPTSRTTDFYEPLRAAEDLLKDARHDDKRVVLISDLQMIGWTGALDNWNLTPGIAFEPVFVGDSSAANTFIDDVAISQRRASGESVVTRFDVRTIRPVNFDQLQEIILEIGGREVARQRLPDKAVGTVSFQHTVDGPGTYQGRLVLPDDQLAVDNVFYFTFKIDRRPSILAVDNSGRSRYSSAFFLDKAFDLGNDGVFSFESASRSRLSRRALSDHDLAFITNFNALSEREVGEITDWVADGGHVVLGMGDATDASAMSQTLAQIGIGTADRVITSRASFGADAIVGDVDWRHPVFNAFAEAGGVILRPRFRKYLKVEADSSAVVIGSYDSGDPFVIEKRVGSGSIIVYTSSINNDWTDFPIDELFVPFLYQLGNYAVESAYRQIMFEVGDVVALPGDANDPWEVRVPSGDVYRVSAGSADVSGGSRGFFRQTEQPGQYLATRGTERLLFSVNVNSSESDLAARNVDEAYAAVVSPFVEQQATQRAGAVQIDDADNQELWHFFLALAIILLVIETVLSHARSSTPGTTAPDIVMTADKRKRL